MSIPGEEKKGKIEVLIEVGRSVGLEVDLRLNDVQGNLYVCVGRGSYF